ncbi:SDR family oxidoreductase [Aquimarina agarivorans]|uniref:SDR family oxidoreductase n=1 Tax=Aquimarina agarivorans TaxID=980584 RepID=UPI000248E73A|nr:SDR family oxidoreductase [Aquimarina agarivorans]
MKEAILITGVTGNVGSHVLFELLFDLHNQQKDTPIYLVIRSSNGKTGWERLHSEVFTPSLIPQKIAPFFKTYIKKNVQVLEGDISNFIIPNDAGNKLTVFHLAASVNLGKGLKAKKEIAATNYKSTKTFF